MRREGLLTGQLWDKDTREMVKVKNMPTNASNSSGRTDAHPVGKVKAKSKGHRSKFDRKAIDDDWDLAATSSRPHDTCGAKVKVSSHALDYDLNDAYDIYAACHAIDVACGAEVDDHTFDIDAACDAIDVACASKINNVDDNSDSYGDGKTCLVSDHVNLIDDAVAHDVKCAFDDSSPDDDDDYENNFAHEIHQAGYTILQKAVDDCVMDAERDGYYDNVKRDEILACTNIGPSVNESNDNDSEISLVESDGNSLSSDWYHVTSSDTEDWYLC